MASTNFFRQLSIWLMRFGLILFVLALLHKFSQPKEEEAMAFASEAAQNCIIECNRSSETHAQMRSEVCLTRSDNQEQSCFAPDEILYVELSRGKTIVYDYNGTGLYVDENLNQIQQAVSRVNSSYIYLQRVNRQEIVNLRYTRRFNTCNRQIELEEDFESTVAKGRVKEIRDILHRTCSIM